MYGILYMHTHTTVQYTIKTEPGECSVEMVRRTLSGFAIKITQT